MANARTVDIKLKFDPTDMTPGAKGRKFRRDVLLHGGKTDARGFSITDCLLRQDEGAVNGPAQGIAPGAVGAAGAPAGLPAWPGAAAAIQFQFWSPRWWPTVRS